MNTLFVYRDITVDKAKPFILLYICKALQNQLALYTKAAICEAFSFVEKHIQSRLVVAGENGEQIGGLIGVIGVMEVYHQSSLFQAMLQEN